MTGITQDTRLQLLLIAFSFGAFFEGASGFGTPVAVTAALLIGLGFKPLQASGLSLIANTAPVAYGALGTPIIALAAVTGYTEVTLGAQVGRILPFFSVLVPFWLVWAYAGYKGMKEIWPAIAVAGVTFAIPQFLVSNFHGPWLTDIIAAMIFDGLPHPVPKDMAAEDDLGARGTPGRRAARRSRSARLQPRRGRARMAAVAGAQRIRFLLGHEHRQEDHEYSGKGVHFHEHLVDAAEQDHQPAVSGDRPQQAVPTHAAGGGETYAEGAVFGLNWLSATGSGILFAAIISGFIMGLSLPKIVRHVVANHVAHPVLAHDHRRHALDRHHDPLLGGGCHHGPGVRAHRVMYPFFGTLLGWLGVALTGSDTSSNVLFGSLQKISAQQIGLSPILMGAANSAGGVMGKMIDAQSIVVASTATEWYGHEGDILRYVFFHSIALAALVGILVTLQAYVFPFTRLVAR